MAPEELANIIRDPPRDTELIELFKAFSGPAPLPARLEERVASEIFAAVV
jgi:hypothetical protein